MNNYITTRNVTDDTVLLDLFSTSATNRGKKCQNRAPYICIPPVSGKTGKLFQACCNDWTCPRCGELRAKEEYGRIVDGSKSLGKDHKLYFITITCVGNVPLDVAENKYLEWTHRFLDAFRLHVKRDQGFWAYAGVTERQKRLTPHSHYIMADCPSDAFYIVEDYPRYLEAVNTVNSKIPKAMRFSPAHLDTFSHLEMFSVWMALAAVKAGLGVQCRISRIDTPVAVAVYLGKYLFKTAISTDWPKGWKRVRYSQNWPKLLEIEPMDAFPVLSAYDWKMVANCDGTIEAFDERAYEMALLWQCENVICRVENSIDLPTKD